MSETVTLPATHWGETAKMWDHIGPPLRLVAEEIEFFREAVSMIERRPLEAVIMGVTQELYRMSWPEATHLQAVDHMQPMIDKVWLGPAVTAHCADWRAMPFETGSKHATVCDGGLSMIEFPAAVKDTARELHRVLAKDAICVFRLYVVPSEPETPDAILQDLLKGEIPDLSHLKLRLWTALQKSPEEGTCVARVYDAFDKAVSNREELAGSIGWPLEHMNFINLYRECRDVYRFPSTSQVEEIFSEAGFQLELRKHPSHSLGAWTPIVVFKRI